MPPAEHRRFARVEQRCASVARWIQTYQRRWEGRLDRLGGYLERNKGAQR
jgi:hypothetical protein